MRRLRTELCDRIGIELPIIQAPVGSAAGLEAATMALVPAAVDAEGRCTHPDTGGSMPKGYWVSAYRTVTDPEKLAAYNKLAAPAARAGGGRTLIRGGRVLAHGAGIAERTVLVEFDSFEQAVATYESPAYQEALAALSDGVERDFRIVEGID